MQKFVDNGSLRRMIATGVALGAVLLNKKVGLDLDQSQQELITYLVITYVTGSNAKEAVLSRATAAGEAAAKAVEDPEKVIRDAVKKGGE